MMAFFGEQAPRGSGVNNNNNNNYFIIIGPWAVESKQE
jgi:hypothetical protein